MKRENHDRPELMSCRRAGDKWDLSPNDRAAIADALATIAELRAEVAEMKGQHVLARIDEGEALDRVRQLEAEVAALTAQLATAREDAIEEALAIIVAEADRAKGAAK